MILTLHHIRPHRLVGNKSPCIYLVLKQLPFHNQNLPQNNRSLNSGDLEEPPTKPIWPLEITRSCIIPSIQFLLYHQDATHARALQAVTGCKPVIQCTRYQKYNNKAGPINSFSTQSSSSSAPRYPKISGGTGLRTIMTPSSSMSVPSSRAFSSDFHPIQSPSNKDTIPCS